MEELEYIEISSKNVDDAITEACEHFGVTSDRLEYEVIQQGSTGFLGLNVKPAVIRARIKKDGTEASSEVQETEGPVSEDDNDKKDSFRKRDRQKPEKESYGDRSEGSPEQKRSLGKRNPLPANVSGYPADSYVENEFTEKAKAFLSEVFGAMGMEVRISSRYQPDDRILEVDLEGEEMGVLIGKRGQTLDSLQYLISLVVNRDSEEYIHVKVDTENYRERRKVTLENLARNIAYKVRKSRQPVKLEPMNPYERRIIHSALQSDKYVTTHSEGEEPYRYVVVTMKR